MSQFQKAMLVLLVVMVGIWGCAQGRSGSSSADKIKALEGKVSRLEEDFRAAATARDQFRVKVTEAEQTVVQLQQDLDSLQPVIKERDDLRVQLKARTQERDLLTTQFDGFRKNLKDLIGQTESALSKPPAPPINTVSQPKKPNL